MKTYYTVYKTTNKITRRYYIGTHKTNNPDDDYLGSGNYLRNAIKKYGKENFEKEILFVYDNSKEMFDMERKLVNENFVNSNDTYNIKIGGFGGWEHLSEEQIKKGNKSRGISWKKKYNSDLEFREKINNNIRKMNKLVKEKYPEGTTKGKKHTKEAKRKIGNINSIHQRGDGNSQYGTMWVTNGKENKKIKREDIIPEGWSEGRIIPGIAEDMWIKDQIKKQRKKEQIEIKKLKALLSKEKKSLEKIGNYYKNHRIKLETIDLYNKFIKGKYTSLREYYNSVECNVTLQALAKRFHRYIPEYHNNVRARVSYNRARGNKGRAVLPEDCKPSP